jgi:hypothetical protein
VLGVLRRFGTGKESRKPYDFTVVKTMRPVQAVATDRMTVQGHGFFEVEVSADDKVVSQFAGVKLPAELELLTDARPDRFGKLELVVVGVAK